jgi:hypothetical protein
LLFLFVAVFFVTASPGALAACNTTVDQVVAVRQADSVFVGRVTELADFNRSATMAVLEIWKGPDLPASVVVNGSFSGSPQVGANDRTYVLGATYLVVPFGNRAPFFDEACSGTGLYSPAGGLIPGQFHDAVGATTGRIPDIPAATTPGSDEPAGVSPLVLGGAGAVVLVLMVLVLRRRKRGGRVVPAATAPVPLAGPPSPAPSRSRKAEKPLTTVSATAAVASVAGRKKRKARKTLKVGSATGSKSDRFHRSGMSNVASTRKKIRKRKRKRAGTKAEG